MSEYKLRVLFMDEALSFVKKSQKTPPKEIIKAEEIRKKYFELKHQ